MGTRKLTGVPAALFTVLILLAGCVLSDDYNLSLLETVEDFEDAVLDSNYSLLVLGESSAVRESESGNGFLEISLTGGSYPGTQAMVLLREGQQVLPLEGSRTYSLSFDVNIQSMDSSLILIIPVAASETGTENDQAIYLVYSSPGIFAVYTGTETNALAGTGGSIKGTLAMDAWHTVTLTGIPSYDDDYTNSSHDVACGVLSFTAHTWQEAPWHRFYLKAFRGTGVFRIDNLRVRME